MPCVCSEYHMENGRHHIVIYYAQKFTTYNRVVFPGHVYQRNRVSHINCVSNEYHNLVLIGRWLINTHYDSLCTEFSLKFATLLELHTNT